MYRQYLSDSWLFKQWDWQWMVTVSLPDEVSRERITGRLKDWRNSLARAEHIQLGYMGILVRKDNRYHLHLLAIGHGLRNGRPITLRDINLERWKNSWGHPRAAKIEIPRSNDAVSNYLAIQNFEWKSDYCELLYYDRKLLKKHRKRENAPLFGFRHE